MQTAFPTRASRGQSLGSRVSGGIDWNMARDFGRVRARRGGKNGWEIDLGRGITPRFLYSARGARFESEKMAQAILDAIRVRIARGAAPQ